MSMTNAVLYVHQLQGDPQYRADDIADVARVSYRFPLLEASMPPMISIQGWDDIAPDVAIAVCGGAV